ncbi:MAG TPA: hypothetical protein VGV09_18640 [Steroidobacteraceae bacterium]|nr:hypothetical protein [Steroidobacteraceae bacterium]
MSDMMLTDMNPFFERHERKSRRLMVGLSCVSLAVGAGTFAYGTLTSGAPGALLAKLWASILFYPLIGVVVWTVIALSTRWRRGASTGRAAMNPDDARSAARVANAGLIYIVCVGAIMIVTQAALALGYFGVLPPSIKSGVLIVRASGVACGVLIMYFGNAWSRRPTPRTPAQKAAALMKFNRLVAWLIVIYGLLLGLSTLLLPVRSLGIAVLVLTVAFLLCLVANVFRLRNAVKRADPS